MKTRVIESSPFAGASSARYQAARRELRQLVAALYGLEVSRVRIAPAAVTLQRRSAAGWIGYRKDVIDQHAWLLRHAKPDDVFRLVIQVRV